MFRIGKHTIDSNVVLAPMAGVSDLPFRNLCLAFGAGLATSEMITSDTRLWNSKKTRMRLADDGNSQGAIKSLQIAGSDPQMLADAARLAQDKGAEIVDINMGCPAKKVCKKLAGSALLKDEKLVAEILKSVTKSVSIPVTLKTRTGWDQNTKNICRVAKIAEDSGIQALTIHGRTRACRFQGNAEYDSIAEVVNLIQIPVIANGDISSPEGAKKVLDYTGASAVMLGRASLGNPWLFREVNHYLATGTPAPAALETEQLTIIKQHMCAIHSFYGDIQGVRIARKHIGWYCKTAKASPGFSRHFNKLESTQSQLNAVDEIFQRLDHYEEIAA